MTSFAQVIVARKLVAGAALVLAASTGCAPLGRAPAQSAFESRALHDDLDVESLRLAIAQSLSYLKKLPPERVIGQAPRPLTAREVADSLASFVNLLDLWECSECFWRALTEGFEFAPASSEPNDSEILFTGYYQPVLEASLLPTETYRFPIYRKPPDLITAEHVWLKPALRIEKVFGRAEGEQFMPYYSRQEIDQAGVLRNRGLEIAWVKDAVDLFFLHIQGSGLLRLPDGRQLSVGYAAQNGRPYRSIGRMLIDRGKLSSAEMSMQALRRYLEQNPRERDDIFAYNPSYVFFQMLENGPLGSLGVPVTPARSIATDARLFAHGALAWIETEVPVLNDAGEVAGWRPSGRFVLNQDTGGAIRGLRRVDIYFGSGDRAGGLAGYMNRPGRMFFLIRKKKAE